MPDGLTFSGYLPGATVAPAAPVVTPVTSDPIIEDGLSFHGWTQPPDVPPDPIGEDWRGETGPIGPAGKDAVTAVTSVAGRTGAVTLVHGDLTDWAATLAPYALTASVAALAPVQSFNTRTGAVSLTSGDVTTALAYTPYDATNPSGYQTAANVTTTLAPYALTTALSAYLTTAAAASTYQTALGFTPYNATNPSGYQTVANVTTTLAPYATTAATTTAIGVETSRATAAEALLASTASMTTAIGVETSRATTAEGLLAPKASPTFTGTPTLPTGTIAVTQTAGNNTTAVATTAFTTAAVTAGAYTLPTATASVLGGTKPDGTTIANTAGAISVAYGTSGTTAAAGNDSRIMGALSAATAASTYATIANDVLKAPIASPTFTGTVTIPGGASISGFAPLASPTFTGNPLAPTPSPGDSDTSIATTAFVAAAIVAATTGVASFNTRTGAVTLTSGDVTGLGAYAGSFTTLAASSTVSGTGFSTYLASPPAIGGTAAAAAKFTTLDASSTVSGAGFTTLLSPYAPLASPTFTGTPTLPTGTIGVTQTALNSTTALATTAFTTLAVGVETTRATAAEAAVANTAAQDVGRNLIHNGLFRVQQRGAGAWTTNVYTADRWVINSSLDTFSFSITSIGDAGRTAIGDETALPCLANAFTGNAGAGAFNWIAQSIEDVRRLSGKTVTVSFWAIAASGTPKLGVSIDQSFGTGGSAAVNGTGSAVTLSTAWVRYSVSLAVPSSSGKTIAGGDHYSALRFWFSSGATNATRSGTVGVQSATISLWGVQLEIGSVATPLEKPDPRYELANCQRFYQAHSQIMVPSYAGAGFLFYGCFILPVTMRVAPSVGFATTSYGNASAVASAGARASNVTIQATATALGGAYAITDLLLSADL